MVIYKNRRQADAVEIIQRATREISSRLSEAERLVCSGNHPALIKNLGRLRAIADQIGMVLLAEVALDVVSCHDRGDDPAFGATIARLVRVGDSSLSAMWEVQDLGG